MSDIQLAYEINGLGNGLITGLQGAGKSHFVMTQIKWLVDNTDLNLFLINVDGVQLDSPRFSTADPDFNWIEDAPQNSIIIYDEAGTIDRFSNSNKTINSNAEVAELTKLRHHGKQVFFIAQDPSLLHPAVRKLMVRHLHFSNPYNDPNKTHCFVFPQTVDKIDGVSKGWKKAAIEEFDHPLHPEIFPLYKSVQEGAKHVKKKQKNAKAQRVFIAVMVVCVLALLAFVGMIALGFKWYADFNKPIEASAVEESSIVQQGRETVKAVTNPTQQPVNDRAQADNARFKREQELYALRLPNDYAIIAGNDDLRVAAVMQMRGDCVAYNAHGERLSISDDECQYYLADSGRMIKRHDVSRVITQYPTQQPQEQGDGSV